MNEVMSNSNKIMNCSDLRSIFNTVTQLSLMKKVAESCDKIRDYIKPLGHINKNYCNWIYCTFKPVCNPTQNSTSEVFDYIAENSPQHCTLSTTTCKSCNSY